MDTLTLGKNNPRLADIRRALNGDTLTDDGLLPVEGPRLIREAQNSGLVVAALFVRSDVSTNGMGEGVPTYTLDQPAFRKIQTTESSQGLIALVRVKASTVAEIVSKMEAGPAVVLAQLQDPGNAGTILRVAESFGASGCIGLTNTVALYNPKVVRASAGSVFRLPCTWNVSLQDAASELHAAGVSIVGTSPHAAQSIDQWDWRTKTAILIGNEGSGLNPPDLELCDAVLRIPLRPPVESLNSAIAASVILYESFKQRGLTGGFQ
ncbi:MAG TPA: RNA methyltransferase [Terriglobia bacterium]|nr:RNA methyltransferase [Terriglobia bacterium]